MKREWFINIPAVDLYKSLEKKTRNKVFYLVIMQTIANLFDLIGVLAIGLLTSFALLQSTQTLKIFEYLSGSLGMNLKNQNVILVVIIVSFFLKTITSIYSTRRILSYLSQEYGYVSGRLVSKILMQPIHKDVNRSKQEILYLCTKGLESAYLLVLAPTLTVLPDVALLAFLFGGAFLVNQQLALLFLAVFGGISILIGKSINQRMKSLGAEYSKLNIESNEEILETMAINREIILVGKIEVFLNKLMSSRKKLSKVISDASIIPYITKYMVEAGTLIGLVIVALISIFGSNSKVVYVSLSVFLAVAARMTPAVLRIQQSILMIKNNSQISTSTMLLVKKLKAENVQFELKSSDTEQELLPSKFEPIVSIRNLSYSHNSGPELFRDFSLDIPSNSFTAIVGPSGSGKTTLVDLILGFLQPLKGTILISSDDPLSSIKKNPGKISYVPQEINLISGTLAENIALGVKFSQIDNHRFEQVLRASALIDLVSTLPQGIKTQIGEKGLTLSGGQKQRIGIARGLYCDPQLLVLDEATSSLDGELESIVVESLFRTFQDRTIIVIAHRLSTIMNADQVVYLEEGSRPRVGTFEYLRSNIPAFENQAFQLGL